jgi:hypothetical protein
LQCVYRFGVIGTIPLNLGAPEFRTRAWQPEQMTVVTMPKASVNKNRRVITRQYDIRLAGKLANVKSEPESPTMQQAPNK